MANKSLACCFHTLAHDLNLNPDAVPEKSRVRARARVRSRKAGIQWFTYMPDRVRQYLQISKAKRSFLPC